jgi:hypothetical protein
VTWPPKLDMRQHLLDASYSPTHIGNYLYIMPLFSSTLARYVWYPPHHPSLTYLYEQPSVPDTARSVFSFLFYSILFFSSPPSFFYHLSKYPPFPLKPNRSVHVCFQHHCSSLTRASTAANMEGNTLQATNTSQQACCKLPPHSVYYILHFVSQFLCNTLLSASSPLYHSHSIFSSLCMLWERADFANEKLPARTLPIYLPVSRPD